MFLTIRNFTPFYAGTCTLAILFMWPMMIMASDYEVFGKEWLGRHMNTILFE